MLIKQSDPTPWVILIILLITGICVSGILIGNTEILNPQRAAQSVKSTSTYDGLAYQATQGVINATLVSRQSTQAYEVIAAQATVAPVEQTLVAAHAASTQAVLQAQATQDAILAQGDLDRIQRNATMTQVAINAIATHNQTEWNKTSQFIEMGFVGILTISFATSLLFFGRTLSSLTRRKEKEAEAAAALQERRLLQVKVAIESKQFYASMSPIKDRQNVGESSDIPEGIPIELPNTVFTQKFN